MNKKTIISIASFLFFLILGFAVKFFIFFQNLDLRIILFFKKYSLCRNVNLNLLITNLADKKTIIIASFLLFLWYFFWIKRRKYAIFFILTIGFSEIIKEVFKLFFSRERPNISHLAGAFSYSYPSGHTLIFFVFLFFAFLPFLTNIQKKAILIALWLFISLLVGFSRICLTVHWPFDILGSFFLGISIIEASLLVLNYKKYDSKKN